MNALSNSVQLIGNLGAALEKVSFKDGNYLVKFPLATSEYWTNSDGEKVQNTQWHQVVAKGKLAENMEKVLEKGHKVVLQGKLVYRSWKGKDGQDRYSAEIVAYNFLKMTPKPA